MPSASRSSLPHTDPASRVSYDVPSEPDTVAEPDSSARNNGSKRKKGRSKDCNVVHNSDEAVSEAITLGQSPPTRASSILGQLPYSFARTQHRAPSPVLDAIGDTEKVSDPDVTERTDEWARAVPYGRSPSTGPAMNVNHNTTSTTAQQIRPGFSTKSPPVSPPQRKARPVSYGSGLRPVPPRQGSSDAA